jgi:hypothetical protein
LRMNINRPLFNIGVRFDSHFSIASIKRSHQYQGDRLDSFEINLLFRVSILKINCISYSDLLKSNGRMLFLNGFCIACLKKKNLFSLTFSVILVIITLNYLLEWASFFFFLLLFE